MRRNFTLFFMMALLLGSGFSGIHAATVQDDMGMGGDASNERTEIALTIMMLEVYEVEGTGYLDEEDTVDWYSLAVGFHKIVSIVMSPPEGSNFDLNVHTYYGGLVGTSATEGSAIESFEGRSAGGILGAGNDTFYIEVIRQSGSGTYSIAITLIETIVQDDMGSGGDAGDEFSEAAEIEAGSGSGFEWSGDYYDFL